MNKPLKSITVVLEPSEVVSLAGIFAMTSDVAKTLGIDLPPFVRNEIANVLEKMMAEVAKQVNGNETGN